MSEPAPEQTSDAPPPSDGTGEQGVQNANAKQIARFVSTIKNAEQQVGEHVVQALQHDDTVAVLTSVVVGPNGQQHIVSAAIGPGEMAQINALLAGAQEVREEEQLCVGFHCLIKPKATKVPTEPLENEADA